MPKKINPNRPNKPTRVDHIVKMMANNEWVTGKSSIALCELWDMSLGELTRDVGEASRQIKAVVSADPELVDRLRVGLEWAKDKAVRLCAKYEQSHPMAAVQAVKAYSEACRVLVAGAQTWARAEADSRAAANQEPPAFAEKTDKELIAALGKK